jgi:hypothetical protein
VTTPAPKMPAAQSNSLMGQAMGPRGGRLAGFAGPGLFDGVLAVIKRLTLILLHYKNGHIQRKGQYPGGQVCRTRRIMSNLPLTVADGTYVYIWQRL